MVLSVRATVSLTPSGFFCHQNSGGVIEWKACDDGFVFAEFVHFVNTSVFVVWNFTAYDVSEST